MKQAEKNSVMETVPRQVMVCQRSIKIFNANNNFCDNLYQRLGKVLLALEMVSFFGILSDTFIQAFS